MFQGALGSCLVGRGMLRCQRFSGSAVGSMNQGKLSLSSIVIVCDCFFLPLLTYVFQGALGSFLVGRWVAAVSKVLRRW